MERQNREALGLRDEAAARAVLEQFFVKIDRDGDDHLSLEELAAVFGERKARLMLRYINRLRPASAFHSTVFIRLIVSHCSYDSLRFAPHCSSSDAESCLLRSSLDTSTGPEQWGLSALRDNADDLLSREEWVEGD